MAWEEISPKNAGYPTLCPGMRESRGHLFPTHFYDTLGIMQACSWQINTRPYEVAVPAELQNMRGTATNFRVPQFVASCAFKSHDPPGIAADYSLCLKKCSVTTLSAGVGTHIPVWSGNTFLHYISCALCSVDNMPTLRCSVKTAMSHHGSVSELGQSLASVPKQSHNMKQCHELCEVLSHSLGRFKTCETSQSLNFFHFI